MDTGIEVKLGVNIYTFATPVAAEEFRTCLMTGNLDDCKREHPPATVRTTEVPDTE
jgi:hypothetical protein